MRKHSESGITGNNEEKDRLKSFIDDPFVIESCVGRAGDGAQTADVADPGSGSRRTCGCRIGTKTGSLRKESESRHG